MMEWAYVLIRTGMKDLDTVNSVEPLTAEKIREILGGDYELIPITRGEVLAALIDRESLPPNSNYENNINGPVLLGKLAEGIFVGCFRVGYGPPPF